MIYFLTRTNSVYLPPIGFSVSTGVSSITSPSYTSLVSFILKPTKIHYSRMLDNYMCYIHCCKLLFNINILLLFAWYVPVPTSLLCRICNRNDCMYCIVLYWSICHSHYRNMQHVFFLQCSVTDWASEMGPGLYKNLIAATDLQDMAYTRYPCTMQPPFNQDLMSQSTRFTSRRNLNICKLIDLNCKLEILQHFLSIISTILLSSTDDLTK